MTDNQRVAFSYGQAVNGPHAIEIRDLSDEERTLESEQAISEGINEWTHGVKLDSVKDNEPEGMEVWQQFEKMERIFGPAI